MKKTLKRTLIIVFLLYILLCGLLYFFQEKLIFHPQKLDKAYQFQFIEKFEEQNITTADGTILNGLLFRADSAIGLVFYLHGNAGSLNKIRDL